MDYNRGMQGDLQECRTGNRSHVPHLHGECSRNAFYNSGSKAKRMFTHGVQLPSTHFYTDVDKKGSCENISRAKGV